MTQMVISGDTIQIGWEGLSRQRAMANLWKICLVVESGSMEPARSAIARPKHISLCACAKAFSKMASNQALLQVGFLVPQRARGKFSTRKR